MILGVSLRLNSTTIASSCNEMYRATLHDASASIDDWLAVRVLVFLEPQNIYATLHLDAFTVKSCRDGQRQSEECVPYGCILSLASVDNTCEELSRVRTVYCSRICEWWWCEVCVFYNVVERDELVDYHTCSEVMSGWAGRGSMRVSSLSETCEYVRWDDE